MKKLIAVLVIAIVMLLVLMGVSSNYAMGFFPMSSPPLSQGSVETILQFGTGNHPEGIVLDTQGNIYVGNRQPVNGDVQPVIIKIAPDGTDSEYARLPLTTRDDAQGLLGLVVSAQGDLYAALVSLDENHGVWKIGRDGYVERLSGSDDMNFPNALTFDSRGYLYATDSFGGSIWRFDSQGQGEEWVQHEWLESGENPVGLVLPGANGIAFFPPDNLYVANTSLGRLVRIKINQDGSPGEVQSIAHEPLGLFSMDGIAADAHGDILAVIPGYFVTGTSPVVKIDTKTGNFTGIVDGSDQIAKFDIPLSLAFGSGARDKQSVYVTNGALEFDFIPPSAGPGVIQVGVGVPGFHGR